MATKLFVGGIAFRTSEETLKSAFEQSGAVVSCRIMTDRETGRSRGFGFVEMESDADAQAAIAMWNGKELDGRQLVVNEARPKEDRPAGAGGFSRGGGSGSFSRGSNRY